jgi:hypothetical protein
LPLRWLIADVEGLPLRTPFETLDVRLWPFPFPLLRDPFAELEAACAPVRLPLVGLAPLAFQRAPEAGREPLAERAAAGRAEEFLVSGPERRAVRLPEELCAGLRSREWAAGRLK